MVEKFWMVFVEVESELGSGHISSSMTRAEEEAQRQALKTGRRAYVLEALGYYELPQPPEMKWMKLGYG